MVNKSGFAISGENFVWTERGLLKVTELSPDDNIMGIDRVGKISWSSLTIVKTERSEILRITTDSNESLLAPKCEIFTVEGIRQASNVSIGDLVETANVPLEILETLDGKAMQSIRFDDHEIELDEKLSYVVGAQIKSKRKQERIIFDQIDTEKAYLLASLCSELRKTPGIGGRIFYVRGGKRIRFDSSIIAELCEEMWKTNNVAVEIRKSPASVMHAFVVGMLDMILQKNKAESPPTFFSTSAYNSELRRFMLNVMRLYGVIPARIRCISKRNGLTYFKCSINTSDLSKLGLKFIRAIKVPRTMRETKAISYSTARNISRFRDKIYYLSTPKPHWSPVIDLTPLHRHAFKR